MDDWGVMDIDIKMCFYSRLYAELLLYRVDIWKINQ